MVSTLIKEQAAFLLDHGKLITYITSKGYYVTAGELLRPIEMQEIYVKTGRSKTMDSMHIQKLAGDINIFDSNGKYISDRNVLSEFGHYWESLSPQNRWGGFFSNFVDCPHYERRLSK